MCTYFSYSYVYVLILLVLENLNYIGGRIIFIKSNQIQLEIQKKKLSVGAGAIA